MSVVGARPNFMKIAPVINAIENHNQTRSQDDNVLDHVLVHTGQHYDRQMSDSFFADLSLPQPDSFLGVGSGSHAAQTAEIMKRFEAVLLEQKPDVLIVAGDVNSTVACALVAAKISLDESGSRPLIAHVESGLRSFDRTMPEEVNRILTDHLSDFLFVTEESGLSNLANEGIAAEKVYFVGNTMIDSLMAYKDKADSSRILDQLQLKCPDTKGSYALLTLHRPSNVDDRSALLNILEGIDELRAECPVIFPAHPRTQKRIAEFKLEDYFIPAHLNQRVNSCGSARIRMTGPLGYIDFLCLMKNAAVVITDSGGIQEETTCLGVPCVTVRENTERPVTILSGTNVLAGVQSAGIREALRRQLGSTFRSGTIPEKWDGKTADRILKVLTAVGPNAALRAGG